MTERPETVALISLGCPKNLVDSEILLARLASAGLVGPAPIDDADVIVINTCGFLAAAREESMEVIAEALECKAAGRTRRVVVAGCLATRDAERLYAAAPGIDAVVGVHDRESIVDAALGTGRHTALRPGPDGVGDDRGRFRLTAPHTAYLRIAEGCSRACTFCTIPAIRGPFRSKPADRVVAEAEELLASGAVELNLIAQDTTAWGADLDPPGRLSDLLRRLDALDGLAWLRLMYAYPARVDADLLEALAGLRHLAPYLDMPLQHAADSVLGPMGRGVGRKRTEDLLGALRSAVPGIAIRTAFIVGFPGETEAAFEELLDFVRRQRFAHVGVFAFSPEPGTPAAELPDPVPPEQAAERAETLMDVQREIVLAANAEAVGRRLEVLVDGVDADTWIGRHAGQAPDIDSVCILDCQSPPAPGTLVPAEVVDYEEYDLVVRPETGRRPSESADT